MSLSNHLTNEDWVALAFLWEKLWITLFFSLPSILWLNIQGRNALSLQFLPQRVRWSWQTTTPTSLHPTDKPSSTSATPVLTTTSSSMTTTSGTSRQPAWRETLSQTSPGPHASMVSEQDGKLFPLMTLVPVQTSTVATLLPSTRTTSRPSDTLQSSTTGTTSSKINRQLSGLLTSNSSYKCRDRRYYIREEIIWLTFRKCSWR